MPSDAIQTSAGIDASAPAQASSSDRRLLGIGTAEGEQGELNAAAAVARKLFSARCEGEPIATVCTLSCTPHRSASASPWAPRACMSRRKIQRQAYANPTLHYGFRSGPLSQDAVFRRPRKSPLWSERLEDPRLVVSPFDR
ncbi:uncharacterized protein PAN0_013c4717 [Moesziomyces antarcticus]|uniref:Uncharacterized protein n=2 Tax=Pseudozyma antarctica TaxID=84753 RepID=A0A5C3FTP3_PSEA2|nr:uncharacterized protein PAN0_013c4717 [Moesziomyces antarcticus]GAK66495.1 hypothetical protein PAN0_013c4717 [Moesziomyces antarcticus]SPO47540.1 uncharacterized protein PSANT_05228 [Moesziomyces antarcticus]